MVRRLALALVTWLAVFGILPATTPEPADTLPERYQAWLRLVAPLISDEERLAFLELKRDYQREAFIERFWQVRDPFPETGSNEFREVWTLRAEEAKARFDTLEGERARALLLYGPPDDERRATCAELLPPLQLWYYSGTEQIRHSFYLVFARRLGSADDPYQLWSPRHGLHDLVDWSVAAGASDQVVVQEIARRCSQGGDILDALLHALDWEAIDAESRLVPSPSSEWLQAFTARSTDLAEDAQLLGASLAIDYPGRYQSRTAVQGMITVPAAETEIGEIGPHRSYNFVVDGEVLRKGELFENFRYRFDLRADTVAGEEIPLILQRYLRPGRYTLIVKLEDLNSQRFFRDELEIEVPQVAVRAVTAAQTAAEPAPEPPAGPEATAGTQLLAEANASLARNDAHTLRLVPPPGQLHTGRLRVEAVTSGDGIAKVSFGLNGRSVMSKTRPPYSVELDLGRSPRTHTLEAVALDIEDRELARDELLVNAGAQRFSLRLLEPRHGKRYRQSLRAHAEVDVPVGEALDRVEFFLNETLLATLYQPPFIQPIILTTDRDLSYVRAVAYLRDGNSTEDLVFINAPDYVDRIQVNLVELYVSVLDRHGRPVDHLGREEFTVLEDGTEQQILRFERVQDLPIHAGILLDTSTSMVEELADAERTAMRFFEQVLTPKDRATVITFNDQPKMTVPFTNSLEVLAGGLAGMMAEGETVLYDSVIYALYYFSGLKGKRAIILISDGEDSRSQFAFDEALDYARHAGVALYAIGLNVPTKSVEVRSKLQRLGNETGGGCFYVDRAVGLKSIYEQIQEELRSQYLIAYQSSGDDGNEFREVAVRLRQPGLEAKTIRGYYP